MRTEPRRQRWAEEQKQVQITVKKKMKVVGGRFIYKLLVALQSSPVVSWAGVHSPPLWHRGCMAGLPCTQGWALGLLQDDYPLASLPLLGYTVSCPVEADGIQKDYVFKLQFKSHVYFFRAESKYTFER